MLEKLGRFMARHHWPVIGLWVALLVAVGGYAAGHTGTAVDEFAIPGAQSQQALDLLEKDFPGAAGTSATVVFEAPSGQTLTDAANAAAIGDTVTNLKALEHVSNVSNPLDQQIVGLTFDHANPQPQLAYSLMNEDKTVGYSSVSYSTAIESQTVAKTMFESLEQAAEPASKAGLNVNFGGAVTDGGNPAESSISDHSDEIGLLIAVIILLIALGSVASMSVPILTAIVAVAMSMMIVNILMESFTIGTVAPILGTMIGLGVGIDYSLFIVSRHRQNLDAGMEVEESIGRAIATSGSAVLFAGICVCIAMCGLVLIGIPYVSNLGLIASMFVAITMVTALTLTPALLGAYGRGINRFAIHHRKEETDPTKTFSGRWAHVTSRHPGAFALIAVVILIVLALPLRSIELGFTDDGDQPTELTQYQSYELLTTNFGPGITGPLIVAVDLPEVTEQNAGAVLATLSGLSTALKDTPGVASVSLPLPNQFPTEADPSKVPTAVIMELVPTTAPNSDATTDLVSTLRDTTIPNALKDGAIPESQVYVGGQTALLIDLTTAIQGRLLWFILAVIAGAFLLLMMVFRSLYVPANAAVMNLLSIGAALGIVVAIFNWGWAKDVIGLTTSVPIVSFVPVMMFAVLFGLSMDYEVFLLSRIKEEHDKTGDNRESVVNGVASTARVITSAALIMISVFLAFVPSPDPTVKMIGFGMAIAVLIDATIVRMLLVPSTMELAGKATWWFPKWLDKILPKIHVE
jgi:RND superfamily putative drug exporter